MSDDFIPGLGSVRHGSAGPDIDRLLAELRDFDDELRIAAAKRVVGCQDARVLSALVGRLKDRNPVVRSRAIEALVATGNHSVAQLIHGLLSDSNESVRVKAAWALGELKHSESIGSLIAALESPSAELAKAAAISLGKIQSVEAAKELVDLLRRSDQAKGLRDARVFALGQMGTIAVKSLLEAECLKELEASGFYIGDDGTCVPNYGRWVPFYEDSVKALVAVGPNFADMVAKSYRVDLSGGTKALIAQYLGKQSSQTGTQTLCKIAKDADPAIRCFAVQSLGGVPVSRESLEVMLTILQKDSVAPIRVAAARALGNVEAADAIDSLCFAAITDTLDFVRQRAIESVRLIASIRSVALGSENARRVIASLQNANDPWVRRSAAQALGSARCADGVPALCLAARQDADPSVAQSAVIALGEIKDTRAMQTLSDILMDDARDSTKRCCAATALGSIGGPACLPPLLCALGSDGNATVRAQAAAALGKIADLASRSVLKLVADGRDPDKNVVLAAKTALSSLEKAGK